MAVSCSVGSGCVLLTVEACDMSSHTSIACWVLLAALWHCRPCDEAQVGGRRDILGARQDVLFGAGSSSLGDLRRCSAGSKFVKIYKHLSQFYSMYSFYFMKEVYVAFKS